MKDQEWQTSARAYLERLASAEYGLQKRLSKKKKSFRYAPSAYHQDLIQLLDQNDEAGFKSLKMLQGYANALGF